MTKHAVRFLELLVVLWTIAATMLWQYERFDKKIYSYHLLDFQILNNRWNFTQEHWKLVQKLGGGYAKVIYAIGNAERGFGTMYYGVSKIDLDIQLLYPIEQWQLRQLIRILKKRVQLPVTKEDIEELSLVYNKSDAENWFKNVWFWYNKPLELEKK